jgi:hypothetical protein
MQQLALGVLLYCWSCVAASLLYYSQLGCLRFPSGFAAAEVQAGCKAGTMAEQRCGCVHTCCSQLV